MVARAALPLTAADLQTQPHGTGQQHQRAPVLVAQPHRATAARAELPRRTQHTLPIRSGPRRQPSHLVSPKAVKPLLPQRTTPASIADLVFLGSCLCPHPTGLAPFLAEQSVNKRARARRRALLRKQRPYPSFYVAQARCPQLERRLNRGSGHP